jgi:hypothetical protein
MTFTENDRAGLLVAHQIAHRERQKLTCNPDLAELMCEWQNRDAAESDMPDFPVHCASGTGWAMARRTK